MVASGALTPGSGDGDRSSRKSSAPGSQIVVDLDGFGCDFSFLDDDYLDAYPDCTQVFDDNQMYDDEYETLQSHFDNIDIPPGVEAPVPWFPGAAENKITIGTTNISILTNAKPQPSLGVLAPGMETSHSLWSVDPWVKKSTTNSSTIETPVHAVSHPHKVVSPPSFWSPPENARCRKQKAPSKYLHHKTKNSGWNSGSRSTFSGVASSHGPHNPPVPVNQYDGVEPALNKNTMKLVSKIPGPYISNASEVSPVTSKWYKHDNSMFPMASPDYLIHYNPLLSEHMSFEEVAYEQSVQDSLAIQKNAMDFGIPLVSSSRSQKEATYLDASPGSSSSQQNAAAKHVNGDEVLMKVHQFKKFDIVQDPSDHHYVHLGSSLRQVKVVKDYFVSVLFILNIFLSSKYMIFYRSHQRAGQRKYRRNGRFWRRIYLVSYTKI